MNFLFTCGGTAGHINPALAVAGILRDRMPDCGILFVGATASTRSNTPKPSASAAGSTSWSIWTNNGSGMSRGRHPRSLGMSFFCQRRNGAIRPGRAGARVCSQNVH